MTDAKLIDGKAAAAALRGRIAVDVETLKQSHGVTPGLAVILVGEDPASLIYVRSKARQVTDCGMASFEHRRPDTTSQADLLTLIDDLNRDDAIHGILVQLPLPAHIDEHIVVNAVAPEKDVDGFHDLNAGRLSVGAEAMTPCTPLGCLTLLVAELGDLSGLDAVVVGRSNVVGKPMAALLLRANCTVTVAHSRTRDLAAVCRRADILVAAVGKPELIRGDWIKPGAAVIDVGIHRVDAQGTQKSRLVGDVAFTEAVTVAGAITPVPGGVGPMTIATLLSNTLIAARRIAGLPAML
ncbi:MAG: bifunctional methylenetetrahydrofolate dehydrogenase/methenyltetrahydrofolate cyclohydrolase FolD [Rhodospirillaceae bacterium]|jgi:methylenetetrahydrofolate dehydrogenase (NADP+)/methenyltetrahydrofolate cyclohydrolase|nr:bifunctional methylenetetrahydrofolate dehydrogenase/methenyltetrahydrofolate cyclohydrolase FolD [Rhodospirillaceae bacterium]